MRSYEEYAASLRKSLEAQAEPKTKAWWEGYVKGSAPFLGVKMGVIRTTLHSWHGNVIDGHLTLDEQKQLGLALIREDHTEEKLAGMLLPADRTPAKDELMELADAVSKEFFVGDLEGGEWYEVE